MDNFRVVIYKALVDNLKIDPRMLSSVRGDQPILIELDSRSNLCIINDKEKVSLSLEVFTKNDSFIRNSSKRILEKLHKQRNVFLYFGMNDDIYFSSDIIIKNTKSLAKDLSELIIFFLDLDKVLIGR